MQTYDIIILPLAERDIVRNTDYIFYEKKAPETAQNLLLGLQNTISRLQFRKKRMTTSESAVIQKISQFR